MSRIVVGALIAQLALATQGAALEIPWSVAQQVASSAGMRRVAAGDIDGDGDLDLLGTYELRDQGVFTEGAYVWYENDLRAAGAAAAGAVEPGWTRHPMPFGGPAAPVYALDLDGDGLPESTDPVLVTVATAPTVTDGMSEFVFPGVAAERTLPCCNQEGMFSVWLEIAAGASVAGLPEPVELSFAGPTVSAVDAIDALPVTVSPFFDDAAVQFTVTAAATDQIFADDFESGDLSNWP